MTEVQKYLLKLIKEIDELCTANDIEYYVFAGSMLGLERNEGFLPWDDDIDLIMTEKNYQKFIEVMRTNPYPNRVFECRENNPGYPLLFGKYMSTDMTGLIRPHAFGNAESGLWIDIIHATPAPTSKRRQEFIKKWFCCYGEINNDIYIEYANRYDGFYGRYKFCMLLKSIFGKKRIDKWADKLFNSYSEEKCDEYLMYHSMYADYRFFDKKYFEKPVKLPFEGMELSFTPYNRQFCRVLFGDSWMMVPEIDDRANHVIVVDFDIPYYKYVNDYLPIFDVEQVMKDLKEVKHLQNRQLVYRKKYSRKKNRISGLLLNEHIKAELKSSGLDLNAELEAGNIELINNVFAEYEELQFRRLVSLWGVFLPLDDDLLFPYLKKCLCYDGHYYKAAKILRMRTNSVKAPLSSQLKELLPIIDICRSLSVALWDLRDMRKLEDVISTQIEGKGYGFCIDFELAKLYLKMDKAKTSEDLDEIKNDIEAVLKIIPKQWECIKLLGDIEYRKGNLEEAVKLYEKAEIGLNNGVLLLDIRKKKEEGYSENS